MSARFTKVEIITAIAAALDDAEPADLQAITDDVQQLLRTKYAQSCVPMGARYAYDDGHTIAEVNLREFLGNNTFDDVEIDLLLRLEVGARVSFSGGAAGVRTIYRLEAP